MGLSDDEDEAKARGCAQKWVRQSCRGSAEGSERRADSMTTKIPKADATARLLSVQSTQKTMHVMGKARAGRLKRSQEAHDVHAAAA